MQERKIIRRLSLVGIVGNTVLAAFKLFAGIAGRSQAMVSDSIHSLSDVFATFIAFLGARVSQNEPDKEHPYGHERFESLASIALGLILAATGIALGRAGIVNIINKSGKELAAPGLISLIAAVVSIISKEAMFHYTKHYAKILNSSAFMAEAWHHRSDAFSSIGSLVGIGVSMLGLGIMDSIASVIICVIILKVAYDTVRDGVKKMLDTSCGEEKESEIRSFIASCPGVISVDVLQTRMFGNKVYVDVEVSMDGSLSLREAHTLAERIHENVEERFPEVKHVMTHVNPDK